MEEKSFFQHDGVQVTNSRFVVDGQTYAMSNITSVKAWVNKPSRLWPVLLIIVGLLPVISGSKAYGALIFALAGVIWLLLQKTYYHVQLHTAGGETNALKSNQKEYVEKVVSAINEAIIHRG
ncbi:DUF6232 family protein [Hydrogenophaga defluvii]|uniref:DUF6232 family protein n=1 Tax=Hydrogenophaga defluvii TaxID=249410 RepID=A0ABW2SC07_9BURK